MIAYHMSETLRAGDVMIPDYSGCAQLALPFVQALERSQDCYAAMVLHAKYLRAVLRKSGLREWSNHVKWAVEGAFEFVRRTRFPDRISRLACNYFYADPDSCKTLFRYDWGDEPPEVQQTIRLLEVALEEDAPQRFDMKLYDLAYEAMEQREDIGLTLELARRYFAGEQTEAPIWEYLSGGGARVVRDISACLREDAAPQ